MTRPKGDSDPWLTDPVSRDREIARSVVYGLRTIISLLRGIRDQQAEELQAMRRENREIRSELMDLWRRVPQSETERLATLAQRYGVPICKSAIGCSLPDGHMGNHRGSIRSA